MITLKTLGKSSLQAIFNQVVRHLIKQNKRSVSHGGCVYHNPSGLKCAAGCLIGKKEYNPKWDSDVSVGWEYIPRTKDTTSEHDNLIMALQMVHDNYRPSRWPGRLRTIAKRFDLDVPKEIAL